MTTVQEAYEAWKKDHAIGADEYIAFSAGYTAGRISAFNECNAVLEELKDSL